MLVTTHCGTRWISFGKARSTLDRFLHQERTPVRTIITLLTAVAIEALTFLWPLPLLKGYEGIGNVLFTVFIVLGAIVSKIVGGWVAFKRGEFWPVELRAFGVMVWLATTAVISQR